jgi:dihydropteroate synthase
VTAVSAFRGAWAVRVHDVGASLDAVKVAARMAPPAPGAASGNS